MWRNFFGKKAKIIGIDLNPESKKFKKYGFKIILIDKASHYMMLDAPSQIVNIINEKQNDN